MQKVYTLLIFFILLAEVTFSGQPAASKILLIPLDDRPPCLQFTEKMGLIAGAEVIAPPRELLGKFTKAGDPDAIIEWLRKQDLQSYDAAIISLDMLAYGGLVASRIYNTGKDIAMTRIGIISEIRKKAPELPLYGQSVIMRLAPTADGRNEAYREKLARWADISPYPDHAAERMKLESEIPPAALENYKEARNRNLAVNMEALRLTGSGILDYLVLSQDDAKPRGIHVADRERLAREAETRDLKNKVIIQPGTDEISMLLLVRALNRKYDFSPKVYVTYSSETASNTTMPFEDRPLSSTVGFDIIASGARETKDENEADLLFHVFASRFEEGHAKSFAAAIGEKVRQGKRLMVADVDPKGNIQGGDSLFTETLIGMDVLPRLYSYASWNTAGNTIGTALPQGLLFHLARNRLSSEENKEQIMLAQSWFTFHRVMDDYYFHTLVRPGANALFRQSNRSGFERPEKIARELEKFCRDELQKYFSTLSLQWPAAGSEKAYRPQNMRFSLPWNRTFEGEIDFDL